LPDRTPGKDTKPKAVSAGESVTDPVRKSYSGAGGWHGTVRSRGQTPGAAARSPMVRPVWTNPATMKLAVATTGETAGGCEASKGVDHPRAGSTLRREWKIPGALPGSKDSGQVARTAAVGPGTCAANEPATNDPRGGVSTARN
jgi:hypothetical protein